MKTPTIKEGWVAMPEEEFEDLLGQVAERGARAALATVGLENGHAARDILELRSLLEAWQEARHAAWQAIVKAVVTGLLAAALIGIGIKLKFMGGDQ